MNLLKVTTKESGDIGGGEKATTKKVVRKFRMENFCRSGPHLGLG